jgi:hypothetical protein
MQSDAIIENPGQSQPFEISWVDNETLKYSELGRHVLVRVEIESGLFSDERIIHASSVKRWIDSATGTKTYLTTTDREIIVFRIEGDFRLRQKNCRVAPDSS